MCGRFREKWEPRLRLPLFFPISPSHLMIALRLGPHPLTERWFDFCATTAQDEVTVVTWRCEVGHVVSHEPSAMSLSAVAFSLPALGFPPWFAASTVIPTESFSLGWRGLLFGLGGWGHLPCFCSLESSTCGEFLCILLNLRRLSQNIGFKRLTSDNSCSFVGLNRRRRSVER